MGEMEEMKKLCLFERERGEREIKGFQDGKSGFALLFVDRLPEQLPPAS
jgi:hypothetical protein